MKILDICPFGVYPPRNGMSLRVHNLNSEVSRYHDVRLFAQGIRRFEVKFPLRSWTTRISESYCEDRFVSPASVAAAHVLGKLNYPPLFSGDILKAIRPRALNRSIESHDIIQVEYPWQFEYVCKNNIKNVPLVLVEHDIEFMLWRTLKGARTGLSDRILRIAEEKERYAVERSDVVFTMSQEEKDRMVDIFGVHRAKIHVIPNGVDVARYYPPTERDRERAKEKLGLGDKIAIIFSGSMFKPNIEAVNNILGLAREIRGNNIVFLIVGSIGSRFKSQGNVVFTGFVNDVSPFFKAADIAVNPMASGGGTNLKLLEYLASGLPTISTSTGARGIDAAHEKDVIVSGIEDFPGWIDYLSDRPDARERLGKNGRRVAEERYSWKSIAEKQVKIYEDIVAPAN